MNWSTVLHQRSPHLAYNVSTAGDLCWHQCSMRCQHVQRARLLGLQHLLRMFSDPQPQTMCTCISAMHSNRTTGYGNH